MAITNGNRSITGNRYKSQLLNVNLSQQHQQKQQQQQEQEKQSEDHVKHVPRSSRASGPQTMRVSRRLLATVIVLSIAAHGVSLTSSSWLSPTRDTQSADAIKEPKLRYLGRARLTAGQLHALNEHTDNNLLFVSRHSDNANGANFVGDASNSDDDNIISGHSFDTVTDNESNLHRAYNQQMKDYDDANDYDDDDTQTLQDQAVGSELNERHRVMSRAWDALLASLQPMNEKQLVFNQEQHTVLSSPNSRTLYSSLTQANSNSNSNTNTDNTDNTDNTANTDVIDDERSPDNTNNSDADDTADAIGNNAIVDNNDDVDADVDNDNDNDNNDTASEDTETNRVSIVSPIVTLNTHENNSTIAIPVAVLAQTNAGHGQATPTSGAQHPSHAEDKRDSIMSTASIWWRHPFNYLSSLLTQETAKSADDNGVAKQPSTTPAPPTPPTTTTASNTTPSAPIVEPQSAQAAQLGWIDTIRSYLGINSKRAEGQKELEEEDNLGKQEREAELALAASLSQSQRQLNQANSGAHSKPTTNNVGHINNNNNNNLLSDNRLSARNDASNIDADADGDDTDNNDIIDDIKSSNSNRDAHNFEAARQNLLSYLMSNSQAKHKAMLDSETKRQDAMLRRSSLSANLVESYTDSPLTSEHHYSSPAHRARSYDTIDANREPFTQSVLRDNQSRAPVNDMYFIVLLVGFSAMTVAVVLSAGLFAYRVQTTRKSVSDVDYPTYGVVGPSLNTKPGAGFCSAGGVNAVTSVIDTKSTKSAGSTRSLADLVSPPGSLKASQMGGSTDQLVNVAIGAAQQRQQRAIVNNNNTVANNSGNNSNSNNQQQQQDKQQQQQQQQQGNQNAARMYHYHHQKQQMITSDKASAARHTSASDCDSDDNNDDGAYTVYECPGLASTHEMEVKNPLFLDDLTPISSPAIK